MCVCLCFEKVTNYIVLLYNPSSIHSIHINGPCIAEAYAKTEIAILNTLLMRRSNEISLPFWITRIPIDGHLFYFQYTNHYRREHSKSVTKFSEESNHDYLCRQMIKKLSGKSCPRRDILTISSCPSTY